MTASGEGDLRRVSLISARARAWALGTRRIGMQTFWVRMLLLLLLGRAVEGVLGADASHFDFLLFPILIAPEVVARLHDTGRSGLWAPVPIGFVVAVPRLELILDRLHPAAGAGLFLLSAAWAAVSIWLLAQAGQPEQNRYGPDPDQGIA